MKKQSFKASVWVGGSFLILLSGLITYVMPENSFLTAQDSSFVLEDEGRQDSGEASTIGWRLLQSLDYKQHVVPPELQSKLNKKVRIPGFAVPLSNNFKAIQEVLFVPNQLACIHVPAPPPHLVVFIRLRRPMNLDDLSGPLWATGILQVKHTDSMYGAAAYEMDGIQIDPYTYD